MAGNREEASGPQEPARPGSNPHNPGQRKPGSPGRSAGGGGKAAGANGRSGGSSGRSSGTDGRPTGSSGRAGGTDGRPAGGSEGAGGAGGRPGDADGRSGARHARPPSGDPAAAARTLSADSRRGGVGLATRQPARPPSRVVDTRRRGPGWGYLGTCLLAAVILAVSGFAYVTVRDVASIGSSHAIQSGPSTGPQNILLMGIESRRYWNGAILPPSILAKLHAGNAQAVAAGAGGNDTNTLILIHIFANGKRAVGFSIPRDDWVNFAGTIGPQQTGKIDQAYGVSMFYREEALAQQNVNISQDSLAAQGNEAGQAAAVATVEKLTGVHIDHFAAVNLYGFYELARVLGGVEVCLKHPVHDVKSGANFPAGYQHLDAAQALAFVRQRDGLPNGDLDRTHRQQAFLDSIMHELRGEGVFADLTRAQALLTVAKQYVISDSGWNLLDFAAEARNLSSSNLVFRTLPITGYVTVDGQDANKVDPTYIKQLVHEAFYPSQAHHTTGTSSAARVDAPSQTTVDVYNGGHVVGLAHDVSHVLTSAGYRAGHVGDTAYRSTTAVLFGSGAEASARRIAAAFHTTAVASSSVPAGHVQVLLGIDATMPSVTTLTAPTSSQGTSPATSPEPAVLPTSGPQGGPVAAQNGIPCVN